MQCNGHLPARSRTIIRCRASRISLTIRSGERTRRGTMSPAWSCTHSIPRSCSGFSGRCWAWRAPHRRLMSGWRWRSVSRWYLRFIHCRSRRSRGCRGGRSCYAPRSGLAVSGHMSPAHGAGLCGRCSLRRCSANQWQYRCPSRCSRWIIFWWGNTRNLITESCSEGTRR